MADILKLQHISLCAKVAQELENHIGVKDKVLAEFIINLAKESGNEKEFFNKLEENGAEFTFSFVTTLYNLIQKMMPKNLKIEPKKEEAPLISYEKSKYGESFEESVDREERDPAIIRAKFPALAIPDNPNREELKLDLDLDNTLEDSSKVTKDLELQIAQKTVKRTKSRSKSRSRSRSHKQHRKTKRHSRSPSRGKRSASSTSTDKHKKRKDRDREKKKTLSI